MNYSYLYSIFSHNTRTTQWEDPRIAAAQALYLEQQSSIETLFNGSQTLSQPLSPPNGNFLAISFI